MTDLQFQPLALDCMFAAVNIDGAVAVQSIPLHPDYKSFEAWATNELKEAAKEFRSALNAEARKLAEDRYNALADIPIGKPKAYNNWLHNKIEQVVTEPCRELAHWLLSHEQATIIDNNAYVGSRNQKRGGWKGVWWNNNEGQSVFTSAITGQSYSQSAGQLTPLKSLRIPAETLAENGYLAAIYKQSALSSTFPELDDLLTAVVHCRRVAAADTTDIISAERPKTRPRSGRVRPAQSNSDISR